MKKLPALLLALCMTLSLAACGGREEADEQVNDLKMQTAMESATVEPEQEPVAVDIVDEELRRAYDGGLLPAEWLDNMDAVITFREYSGIATTAVQELYGEHLQEWEREIALAAGADEPMDIEDGFLMLSYLWVTNFRDPESPWPNLDESFEPWAGGNQGERDKQFDYLSWDYPYFPDFRTTAYPERDADYMVGGLMTLPDVVSSVSAERVFPYDEENETLHLDEPLTRDAAVRALLRLTEYRSDLRERFSPDTALPEQIEAIQAAANARREAIRSSETNVICTGTAYYVSNKGSDSNDGHSPETAWRTMGRVGQASLRPGDTVYFERGGLWRGETLECSEGVTYSAYGTGEKPRFYGSVETGVGAEKWALYSDKDGARIWKYYKDMEDIGGVIFNGGESWAERVYGWWVVGRGFMSLDDTTKPFVVEDELSRDLTCVSVIDYSGLNYPIEGWRTGRHGAFYLRCDAGNPGALYEQAEFEVSDSQGWRGSFMFADDCVLDNLCVMYFGDSGVGGNPSRDRNVAVQNCEIGWGGNNIHSYLQAEPTTIEMLSGDGIYGFGDGALIVNNYCHDIDCNGITFESAADCPPVTYKNDCVIRDNLVERCGQGIWLHDPIRAFTPKRVLIEGNIVLHTGEGYVHGSFGQAAGIWVDDGLALRAESVEVRGNTVYRAEYPLYLEWGVDVKDNLILN